MKSLQYILDELLLNNIPYKENGRTPQEGLDCAGLAFYIFKECKGIILQNDLAKNLSHVTEKWWYTDGEFPQVEAWDIVFFAIKNNPILYTDHVGIVYDSESFVHMRKNIGVCKEYLSRWRKHNKIIQIGRYIGT